MLVWTDENGNNKFDASKVKRVIEPQEGGLTIVSGFNEIAFDDRGRTLDHKTRVFSIKAAQCKTGAYNVRSFDISRTGRVNVTRGTCS